MSVSPGSASSETSSSSSSNKSRNPSEDGSSSSSFNGSQGQKRVAEVNSSGGGAPLFYRRMTPQEDLLATLNGIDLLVKQRQELITRLVDHHQNLSRRREIGALVDFSKEIDRIMKMRGLMVKTPDMNRHRKMYQKSSRYRNPQDPIRNRSSSSSARKSLDAIFQQQERETSYDDVNEVDLSELSLKSTSGLKSLQKILGIQAVEKKSKRNRKNKA